jgi:hypothetical protein
MVRSQADKLAPLVSIFCFCKNDVKNIHACIDSILKQSYPHLEIVVQDGASTDGTLEALQSYGDRISLISETDKSPKEAFYKALRRCQGDIIGSCLCDEKLLPDAVKLAVQQFQLYPECGGVYGDTLIAEPGKPLWRKKERDSFSVYAYLSREVHFHFCSFFMRRDALEAVGLHTRLWRESAAEFELVSRLGLGFPLRHIPEVLSIYTQAPQGLSQQPGNLKAFAESMESFVDELCTESSCPPEIKAAKDRIHSTMALKTAEALLPHMPETTELLLAKAGLHTPDPDSYFKLRRRFRKNVGRNPQCPFWGPWKKLAVHVCRKKIRSWTKLPRTLIQNFRRRAA